MARFDLIWMSTPKNTRRRSLAAPVLSPLKDRSTGQLLPLVQLMKEVTTLPGQARQPRISKTPLLHEFVALQDATNLSTLKFIMRIKLWPKTTTHSQAQSYQNTSESVRPR